MNSNSSLSSVLNAPAVLDLVKQLGLDFISADIIPESRSSKDKCIDN